MRGETIYEYHKLSPEDQKTVRRWYWVNVVVMATLLTGLIALVSKFAGDEPGATAQHATVHTQPTLPAERTSVTQPLGP